MLVARLSEAKAAMATTSADKGDEAPAPATPSPSAADAVKVSTTEEAVSIMITPGTGHLGTPVTAREAALEKRRAGENRAVEHIALRPEDAEEDDDEEEVVVVEGAGAGGKRKMKESSADRARTWAAEVAVPGTTGLMAEALEAELIDMTALSGGEEEEEVVEVVAVVKKGKARAKRPRSS